MFLLIIAIVALIGLPILAILALNTLFGLNIDINLYTWASALFLMCVLSPTTNRKD